MADLTERAIKAISEIDAWVDETVADRAGSEFAVTADECYSDVVRAYCEAEIDDPALRRKVLRMTGLEF